ncbi:kinase-like domain-containing protein [Mycena capillaripes]|nr:kinase-like domain-containing protein [Mycena capillaripes]
MVHLTRISATIMGFKLPNRGSGGWAAAKGKLSEKILCPIPVAVLGTALFPGPRVPSVDDFDQLFVLGQHFSKDRAKSYMSQLVVAVAALHEIKVVHRDIKPANILVTQSGHLVLGDFGLAKQFKPSLMHADKSLEPLAVSFDVDPESSSGSF